ncbi:MAG: aldo/keto reductase [Anaerolineae bacterium]|nr:aldo/keto reductase [Anaerolineae bacterium]
MHYRHFGNTGLELSEVGLGGNRLGQDYAPDEHWIELVHHAVALGVTVFDTSESYGWGRSEEMLGRALGNRTDVYVASKMARIPETGEREFSAARMMETVERSLRRLRRDQIDIYQLHSPDRDAMEKYDWAEGMTRLKTQGKIRVAGVAVNGAADGIWLIENGLVDMLQITYNIFVTKAEEKLFELAEQHGVGLLVRMPLARGVLTGKFAPGNPIPDGHRAVLDGERAQANIQKAETLRPIANQYKGGMTRMAHHFSLSPKAVSAIIPGARTIAQLEENVAASNGLGLPGAMRKQIELVRQTWE